MQISDRGYRVSTRHDPDGDIAHIQAWFERFQDEAPVMANQPYQLDFYGQGAGLRIGITTEPRRAAPGAIAAGRQARIAKAIDDIGAANADLEALGSGGGGAMPGVLMRAINPQFNDPFDDKRLPGGDFVPPVFPPPDPGGGGGGTFHSRARIELFIYGETNPVQTWELNEGVDDHVRFVEFFQEGFPAADSPIRRTGWWRVVVTPLGHDPVMIYVIAKAGLGDMPIRTTPLSLRLTNHLFRVALEAFVPRAVIEWDKLIISIGPEIAEMLGITPTLHTKDIGPGNSHANLQSLAITSVAGSAMKEIAHAHYVERATRYPNPPGTGAATTDTKMKYYFKDELDRLDRVHPDAVCLRIQAQFTDASVSVYGFDAASLEGQAGEMFFAFNDLDTMLPFSFIDIDLTLLASLALPIVRLFKEVPPLTNREFEAAIIGGGAADSNAAHILTYMRAFLERAIGPNSVVHGFRLANKAWQVRNSLEPRIPPLGEDHAPSGTNSMGGIATLLARAGMMSSPADVVGGETAEALAAQPDVGAGDGMPGANLDPPPALAAAAPAAASAAAAALPEGYLPSAEFLQRLDRHQAIVVVMMENRSYDHLLGGLMYALPGNKPDFPYDGIPPGAFNPGVAGLEKVPAVRAGDLRIGTQIPVSPRHYFEPVQFQIGDGTEAGRGTGDMKGFARDLYHKSDSPQFAMTYYGEGELPVHYRLAREFVTCDRWFSAHPGPTFPNRFATFMGHIPDLDNFENDDPRIGYLQGRTIFDALSAVGIEWRVFESDLSMIRMFDKYRLDDRNVIPINCKDDGFEATLKNRDVPLPRVMFVEPNFADIPPFTTADDDHAPADLVHGQAFLSRICNLIWQHRFNDVLLIITYDEHGGFYDHVPPPGTLKGGGGPYAPLIPGGPTYLGVRVPTFVISPLVSSERADRTIFDHTSILKTILVHNRAKFSPATMLSFGGRVNQMPDVSVLLDTDTPRPVPQFFTYRGTENPGRINTGPLPSNMSPVGTHATEFVTEGGASAASPAPLPPDPPIVMERTVPPAAEEERDFHAALVNMLKPRKP